MDESPAYRCTPGFFLQADRGEGGRPLSPVSAFGLLVYRFHLSEHGAAQGHGSVELGDLFDRLAALFGIVDIVCAEFPYERIDFKEAGLNHLRQ